MKNLTFLLCGIAILLSSGFFLMNNTNGESFYDKTERYKEWTKTEAYTQAVNSMENGSASETEKQLIINGFKIFEGSTIEELSTIFKVEKAGDGFCYWVTIFEEEGTCSSSSKCALSTGKYRNDMCFQIEICNQSITSNDRVVDCGDCCS